VKVAIPKETAQDERRVALVPDTAAKLIAAGLEVAVEQGAGLVVEVRRLPAAVYEAAGTVLVGTAWGLVHPVECDEQVHRQDSHAVLPSRWATLATPRASVEGSTIENRCVHFAEIAGLFVGFGALDHPKRGTSALRSS